MARKPAAGGPNLDTASPILVLLMLALSAGCGSGSANANPDAGDVALPESCDGEPLSDWEQMMLDEHNRWRASVSPPAANMHRLHWDAAIAANAAAWVASCDPNWPHSPAASRVGVGGYPNLGENLSFCAGTGCADLASVRDGSGRGDGEGWWSERHDYDWATNTSSGITSHYLHLASSDVYAIGCATQRCDAPGPFDWDGEWWWTICQYGPRGRGFWSDQKPYDEGEGGLIEPPESVYDDHPALCRASD